MAHWQNVGKQPQVLWAGFPPRFVLAGVMARRAEGEQPLSSPAGTAVNGQADAANHRITDALAITEPDPVPGEEEDSESEQAS